MKTATNVPPIIQSVPGSRPYRLYTIEHVPYGAFPRYRDGGPSMVAYDGWSVSTSSQTTAFGGTITEPGHKVRVMRNPCRLGEPYDATKTEQHPIDGQVFATDDEAVQAQYEAGVLAYMVFEPGSAFGLDAAKVNDRLVAQAQVVEREPADAPVWLGLDEASAWATGYNAALRDLGMVTD